MGQFCLVSYERWNYFRFLNRETRDTVLAKHSMGEFRFQFRITFYQLLILEFLKTGTQTILELILL